MLSSGALLGSSMVPASAQTTAPPAAETADLGSAVCLTDFEPLARSKMSHMAFEYVAGAAADEITMRWNREAFDRIRLRPRVLIDIERLDTSVTLFKQRLPFPVMLAPTAFHRLSHPEGELATAQGARRADALVVLSTLSTVPVEDVARAAGRPLWFQLYFQDDRGFTRHLIERAQDAGCSALVFTVDTPIEGARNRQQRAHFALPKEMELPHLKGLPVRASGAGGTVRERDLFASLLPTRLTWSDLDWIRSFVKVPVLLKGILNPDDARLAVKAGAEGIIVSNHGGRNLDTAPATAEALPEIVDAVAGRVPVLVDGGIRRGTDVLKAMALGAAAVLIGRPFVYGLAAGGADGVARVINILRHEFEIAMALAGRPTIASIDRSVLWPEKT